MKLRYSTLALMAIMVSGCQTISQSETPALYDVLEKYKTLAGRACLYGNSTTANVTATGVSSITQATADPAVLRATVVAPGGLSSGQLVWNTRTGEAKCGNQVTPPDLVGTKWISLTEQAASQLLVTTSFQPYGGNRGSSKARANAQSAEREATLVARIGRGPIVLPVEGKAGYKRYLENRPANQNSVMITTSSGASGGFAWNRDLEIAKNDAMRICIRNAKAKGDVADCAIYDINGEIVWDFSAPTTETRVSDQTVTERLKKVQELLDQGLISETDASVKRAEILESL